MPQVDEAGIDMLLVGDSVAMVVHGHDTTLPITMDEMLTHCKAAARGASRAFLVGDMPFGSGACGGWVRCAGARKGRVASAGATVPGGASPASGPAASLFASCTHAAPPHGHAVEVSPEHAVRSAIRMMKEGGMDAIKSEGGFSNRVKAVGAVVEAGVAVMGHVGLTPQSISVLGGFRPAGQSGG